MAVTTERELDDLLVAAHDAYGQFAATSPHARAVMLRALADRLDAERDDLTDLAARETGLSTVRLTGEIARTSAQLRMFAAVAEEGSYLEVVLDSHRQEGGGPPRPDLRRCLRPVGPVLVFAASNFPFAFSVLGGDTASALACGAPVILKAHPSHPNLSACVARLAATVLAEHRVPVGVLSVIFGDESGLRALRSPQVKACSFTGSTVGGRFLSNVAATRPDPIPFYGELGSVNPVVVTPAAAAARGVDIVAGMVASFALDAGQYCTKPGLVFLPHDHGLDDALVDAVAARAPSPMLNERIHEQFSAAVDELARHDAVHLLCRGQEAPRDGIWATPLLFTTTTAALVADAESLMAERFGPVALVVTYAGIEELTRVLSTAPGSLTATLHAEVEDEIDTVRLAETLAARAGRVIWNGWPTGVAVSWGMHHGGPWPCTTNQSHTSVGAMAIKRWMAPICYQSAPQSALPPALRDANPWRLPRRIDGKLTP